jgi:hypothetical protein
MKKAFLTSMIVMSVIFSVQCSLNSQEVKLHTNTASHSINNSTLIETQSRSDDLKSKEIAQLVYEAVRKEIKDESLNLSLKNLREVASDAEFETRVWVGFGLMYPRCFILKKQDGKQQAFYIGPKVISNKSAMGVKEEVSMSPTVLDTPKSGWDMFDRFLKEQGIDSPLKLSLDEKYTLDPDGEIIAVEVKSGTTYSMAFYPIFTKSTDGQKVLSVCRRIEQEFDIGMGCGNPPDPAQ